MLVAQRPPHKHLGLQWEFPGGKVEPGETAAIALAREIREELHCDIKVGQALPASRHTYPGVAIEMFPFVCQLAEGARPALHEHVALQWVVPEQLTSLDLAAADIPVVGHFLATLAN